MPLTPSEHTTLKPGDVVNIGIDLPDMTFVEDLATIIRIEDREFVLQLCGGGLPRHMQITSGATILISKGEGQELLQCTARLINVDAHGTLRIELPKRVVVNERRAYMRVDVSLPIHYFLPQNQNMANVISEWENSKELRGTCHEGVSQIPAGGNSTVNLSGSGLSIKTYDRLAPGTLLHLKIGLPGDNPEHIHIVGSIIRTSELSAEPDREKQYATSMAFRKIENSDRQKLTRHILDEQRKTVLQYNETHL
jgi:Family of unknown function (DUF5634) N-terminal domain/PilZ domain